jgi:hypothetical protein
MPIAAAVIGGGLGLIGSSMAASSADRAARTSANAQLEAARIAAEEQRFKPVGITSRFGQSQFQFGPEGRLSGASYTASPEIQALQDRLSALYGLSLGQAEEAQGLMPGISQQARGLFNLGTSYLSESPEQARQRIFNQLQAVREPAQMREEQRLGAGAFGRGRTGLNISGMGQPELFALVQAREEQRMRDALAAEQQAQQQIEFGRGLFGSGLGLQEAGYGLQTSALGPFQSQFGLTQLLEEAAQQPLDIGAQLGGRSAQAGANVGQTLLSGGQTAANLRLQGSLLGPTLQANQLSDLVRNKDFTQGIAGLFTSPSTAGGGYFGGIGTPQVTTPSSIYDITYGGTPRLG